MQQGKYANTYKFIEKDVAAVMYKQTILPVVEYADQMVKSGPTDKITRLQSLQDKAVRIIDNREHPELDIEGLSNLYRITPRNEEQSRAFKCAIMYRLSSKTMVETVRPEIHLRNRNKIKFRTYKSVYEKYLKSPCAQGSTMWDQNLCKDPPQR